MNHRTTPTENIQEALPERYAEFDATRACMLRSSQLGKKLKTSSKMSPGSPTCRSRLSRIASRGEEYIIFRRQSCISRGYPMVWCGAILPPMHRHQHTLHDKTRTRVWHKAFEDGMKKKFYSDSILSRVIIDLSVYPKN